MSRVALAGALLAGTAFGTWAPSAVASTVASVDGIRALGEPGEANRFTATDDGDAVVVSDDGAPITSVGAGCTRVSASSARCVPSRPPSVPPAVIVDGADGNDVIDARGTSRNVALHGGPGADEIVGGAGPTMVDAGPGDDVVRGTDGPIQVAAQPGDGADRIVGGAALLSQDSMTWEHETAPVSVTLDGVANDGTPGEGDDVTGVEQIIGSPYDDRLVGDDGNQWLISGGDGDDVIDGRGGSDTLQGGPGADDLSGGAGQDGVRAAEGPSNAKPVGVRIDTDDVADDGQPGEGDNVHSDVEMLQGTGADDVLVATGGAGNVLSGGGGADVLVTGAGHDLVTGGPGEDTVDTGDGPDKIEVQDGQVDHVTCGGGYDLLSVDLVDVLSADCEEAGTQPLGIPPGPGPGMVPPPAPPQAPPPGPTAAKLSVASSATASPSLRTVSLAVGCGKIECRGSVVLSTPKLRLGAASFSATRTRSVTIRLTRVGRAALRKERRLVGTARVTAKAAGGKRVVATKRVVVSARR